MTRVVWFILNIHGTNDSQELYLRLSKLITFWQLITTDGHGWGTYHVKCEEKNFEKLRDLFQDQEFIPVWGVVKSGVVEGGNLMDWPTKTLYERTPPTLTTKPEKISWIKATINRILGLEQ